VEPRHPTQSIGMLMRVMTGKVIGARPVRTMCSSIHSAGALGGCPAGLAGWELWSPDPQRSHMSGPCACLDLLTLFIRLGSKAPPAAARYPVREAFRCLLSMYQLVTKQKTRSLKSRTNATGDTSGM
jgi:hypothetical protein